jgi:hypothetical protein
VAEEVRHHEKGFIGRLGRINANLHTVEIALVGRRDVDEANANAVTTSD